MSATAHIRLMAQYNQWMNDKLYAACGQLDEGQLAQPCNAFFDSILATLNHIMVADLIWLRRYGGLPAAHELQTALREYPIPNALNAILYADFSALTAARMQLDGLICAWINELTDAHLAQVLDYRNSQDQAHSKRFGDLLSHFFNHQTHHRGQLSTLLWQQGIDIGVTDLVAMIPDS
ncbi:DinB family protein [Pseudoalteromonas fenneropenaei]|uniref:DinB family protein n=1 Tax=Pseudoalteromonas fenneropenaei TaxID=1737459 RepID=A0ABV7CJH9_9GAMM